jgi:HNH endonuclease
LQTPETLCAISKMSNCYKCNIGLLRKEDAPPDIVRQKKYKSEEHILPNFCGGQLTSFDLLCSKCNSELGTEIDGELAKQILFHQLISIKLDRGKQKNSYILAYTTESRKEVLVNKNLEWKYFKPEYKIEHGELVEFICQTRKDAKKTLKGLARKYPKINVEDCLKRLKEIEDFLPEKIDFNHRTIGGKETHRAIAKIAVNYFLFTGGDREIIRDVINYVCVGHTRNNYVTFYYSFLPIHKLEKNEISHIIFLKGDNRKKLLYCYIELFSVANFLVILNRDYEQENFTRQYCYDVIKGGEIKDKEINLTLFYDLFEHLKFKAFNDKHYEETEEYIKDRVTRAYEIIQDLNPKLD